MNKKTALTLTLILFFSIFISIFTIIEPVKAEGNTAWISQSFYTATDTDLEAVGSDPDYTRVKTQGFAKMKNGSIWCFIIGAASDGGQDLFVTKSYDNGSTWTSAELFWDTDFTYGTGYGGKQFIFSCQTINDYWNVYSDRTFLQLQLQAGSWTYSYLVYTVNNGSSWVGINSGHSTTSDAIDLTDKASISTDSRYDGGTGVVMENGRIVLNFYDASNGAGDMQIFCIWSDNVILGSSSTWTKSSQYGSSSEYSENSIVELRNHKLMAVIRDYQGNFARPQYLYYGLTTGDAGSGTIAWDTTGGEFPYFSGFNHCEEYMDIARFSDNISYDANRIVMVWNNHSFDGNPSTSRVSMTMAVSKDEGLTWYSREIISGFSAHPKLIITDNNTFIVAYKDTNVANSDNENDMIQFNIEYVSQGKDSLSESTYTPSTDHYFIDINNMGNNSIVYTDRRTYNITHVNDDIIYWEIQIGNTTGFIDSVNITGINETNYNTNFYQNDTSMYFADTKNLKQYGFDYGVQYYKVRYKKRVVTS